MNEESSHWINRVRSFETITLEEMEDALNEFFNDKYIVASPLFNVNNKWYCMVYYRVPPLLDMIKDTIPIKQAQKEADKLYPNSLS